jgi:hypothetical protein
VPKALPSSAYGFNRRVVCRQVRGKSRFVLGFIASLGTMVSVVKSPSIPARLREIDVSTIDANHHAGDNQMSRLLLR